MTDASPMTLARLLQPLTELHARAGRPLPQAVVVPPEEVPEPYRSLLVHERDMTRTLERYHGQRLHLEVLTRLHDGGANYWREVVLRLDGSNQPAEFGAIQIHLERFPEPWRALVLEERVPLGAILNASGLEYTSRPSAYLQFQADAFIAGLFRIEGPVVLYGRKNTLRDGAGAVLADIVEILPPG